ncbi:hypothetical protein M8J76_014964 [Diaphorina citri]|nr:hypothetical protein M8J75_015841 [Diaphorina citri]KAI5719793.1 hypothetical protein M8J76_014964 [Diaphorina citri]
MGLNRCQRECLIARGSYTTAPRVNHAHLSRRAAKPSLSLTRVLEKIAREPAFRPAKEPNPCDSIHRREPDFHPRLPNPYPRPREILAREPAFPPGERIVPRPAPQ